MPNPKSSCFLKMLKRLNAKERHFLMRYALCAGAEPALSPEFVDDLVQRLVTIGITDLDHAKACYFGMDYHLEWIHAALLVAGGQIALREGMSTPRLGGQTARIEDVDLLVVLQRPDASLVLVLIEAKGVTSFGTKQLDSKVERLRELQAALDPTERWLTPILLLMSPSVSRPSDATLSTYAEKLKGIGFWPEAGLASDGWLELKGFFSDLPDPGHALRIGTCNADGTCAPDIAARKANPYTHWRVEGRRFPTKR